MLPYSVTGSSALTTEVVTRLRRLKFDVHIYVKGCSSRDLSCNVFISRNNELLLNTALSC